MPFRRRAPSPNTQSSLGPIVAASYLLALVPLSLLHGCSGEFGGGNVSPGPASSTDALSTSVAPTSVVGTPTTTTAGVTPGAPTPTGESTAPTVPSEVTPA